MKTLEEILDIFMNKLDCSYRYKTANERDNIKKEIEEYGKQQYNQAIKDAAENAKAFFFYDDFDGSPEFGVNKDSILTLLKP